MELKIPKQEITIKQTKQGKDITCFSAMRDDILLSPCETFGNKKALLEEAMSSGKAITVESCEFSQQWNRHSVKFPYGSGREAGFRQAYGGGDRKPWVPAGYRGQPMPFLAWWKTTAAAMAEAVNAITYAVTSAEMPPPSSDVLFAEARSLVAQYWMAVERNLTFPDSFEPRASDVNVTQPDHKAGAQAAAAAAAPRDDGAGFEDAAFFHDTIASQTTIEGIEGISEMVRTQVPEGAIRANLLLECLKKKRALNLPG